MSPMAPGDTAALEWENGCGGPHRVHESVARKRPVRHVARNFTANRSFQRLNKPAAFSARP
jgi:hypothetical protein